MDYAEFDMLMWMTVAGGFFIVGATIVFLWTTKKLTAIRMYYTGAAFIAIARIWLKFKENPWMFWAIVGAAVVIYCLMHKKVVEKVIFKLTGQHVDWDGDGFTGTERMQRRVGKRKWWIFHEPYVEPVDQNKIETDRTENAT